MLVPGTFALTLLLAALAASGPLSTDFYLPSMPEIAAQLHASPSEVQFTISLFLFGFAAGQIAYGPFSDRHGRKPVLLMSMGIFLVATVLCVMSTSIEMLIGARVLQAFGGAGGVVLSRAVVRDLYSGRQAAREMSIISSVMALAPVLAPMFGGMVQAASGWRGVFTVLGLIGATVAIATYFWLPETLKERATERVSVASIWQSYRIIFRNRAYCAYLAMCTATYSGLLAWLAGSAFLLQNVYRLTAFEFGFVFALGSAGYLIGSNIGARVVVRLGIDTVIGIGAVLATVGGGAFFASLYIGFSSSLAVVLPMTAYLAGLGMVLPQAIAGAMTPFPERAGAASSLFGFIQQTVAALWASLVGLLLDRGAMPLAAAVAIMGVATLVIWIATRGIRKSHAAIHDV
ncbi:multidrug effflux MFS transporter [Undibacter mobilis]|uniref:Bcr/CflA family efflux transporter n=1 Tax=Undibacter mobilis TaxID=2292256 RepID=A0A371B8J8_9BRAD|nr:multidrug effflux MFS transporter [Undibacter mobilis]RDV03890.1 MFS transporter [Undibacter mobilis]